MQSLAGTEARARWSRTRKLRRALLAVGFLCTHLTATFIGWAIAGANDPGEGNPLAPVLWEVLSFPAFYLVRGELVSSHLFGVMACNSLMWTVAFMALTLQLVDQWRS